MKNLKYIGLTIIAFLPLFLVLYMQTFDNKIFMGGDNISYYALGKSITLGEGYTNIHLVGHPPGTHFPPGYPFIISVIMTFFGSSLITLKIANGFFLFLNLIISYYIIKKIANSKPLAIVTTILILFNGHFLFYGSIAMSEMPFTFFSLLSIFLLLQIDFKKKIWINWTFWSLIIVIAFTIYIRTSGIALLGAVVCYFLFQKKWLHGVLTFGMVALLLLPWQIRSSQLGGSSYANQLLSKNPYDKAEGAASVIDIFERIGNNTTRYISKEIPHAIFPSFKVSYSDTEGITHNGDLISWILGCSLILLMIIGILKKDNKKIHIMIGLIIAFNLLILLMWPQIWYGIRFIMPLIPLLIYLILRGTENTVDFILKKVFKSVNRPKWTTYILLILIVTALPRIKELHAYSIRSYPANFATFLQLATYTDQNLPDNSVIISRKPALFYLQSNKTMSRFLYTDDYEKQIERFREQKVTHVVVDQLGYKQTQQYLVPFLTYYSGKFNKVYETSKPTCYLFEFNDSLGYNGERKDGKRSGYGTYQWPDGSIYSGKWKNNKRNGYGILSAANNNTVKCNWVDGKKEGEGIVVLKDSTFVRMKWTNDLSSEYGYLYSKDSVFIKKLRFKPRE